MIRPRSPLLVLFACIGGASGAELTVGPAKTYAKPSLAAAAAHAGDTILIDAGTYTGDVCAWTASNLTIRGVGGRPHIAAAGHYAWGKGTWVFAGDNTTVEDIEFSGAAVPDLNGAGIRLDGSGMTVRRCYFHGNENGILTNAGATSDVLIENSEFAANGAGDGYSHNLYIGHVRTFTFRGNYSHGAKIGHDLKSRASTNIIIANRIMDGATGTGSYTLNLPNGGLSFVIGNLIQQGPASPNSGIVTYGEEGGTNPDQHLYFINNTVVNDLGRGTFLTIAAGTTAALVTNNLFIGPGTLVSGSATLSHNISGDGTLLADRAGYDYRLAAGSAAIDAGIAPGNGSGVSLSPLLAYVHPAMTEARANSGAAIDVGAYEFGSVGGGGTDPGTDPDPGPGTDPGPGPGTGTGDPGGGSGSTAGGGEGSSQGASQSDPGGCGRGTGVALFLVLCLAGMGFRRR